MIDLTKDTALDNGSTKKTKAPYKRAFESLQVEAQNVLVVPCPKPTALSTVCVVTICIHIILLYVPKMQNQKRRKSSQLALYRNPRGRYVIIKSIHLLPGQFRCDLIILRNIFLMIKVIKN